jgi:hypothetical protein
VYILASFVPIITLIAFDQVNSAVTLGCELYPALLDQGLHPALEYFTRSSIINRCVRYLHSSKSFIFSHWCFFHRVIDSHCYVSTRAWRTARRCCFTASAYVQMLSLTIYGGVQRVFLGLYCPVMRRSQSYGVYVTSIVTAVGAPDCVLIAHNFIQTPKTCACNFKSKPSEVYNMQHYCTGSCTSHDECYHSSTPYKQLKEILGEQNH